MHWKSKTSVVLVLTYLPFLFPLTSHAQTEAWQQPQYIQNAFNEIALKNEYRPTDKRILKWQQPIYYQFSYHNLPRNELVENLFNVHFKHLANITGHSITLNQKRANVTIHLTTDKNYGEIITKFAKSKIRNLPRESHCMGNFSSDKTNAITIANIVVPVDHAYSRGLLPACVVEESTQILGLPNDSDWVNPSIANDASKIDLLTGLDFILLKILYDNSLSPGLDFEHSQPIIKRKIRVLQKEGVIPTASTRVNQDGLFPLLYD